jgi:hypothetical protein
VYSGQYTVDGFSIPANHSLLIAKHFLGQGTDQQLGSSFTFSAKSKTAALQMMVLAFIRIWV